MGLKRIANVAMAILLTAAVAIPGTGCVTTKKIAHTATFGLVGDKENIQKAKEEKQAKKQAEREREQQKKADKQERKRARKEAEKQEKAEKKARKQAKNEVKEESKDKPEPSEPKQKRGFWNKATFGLVGGGDKADEKKEVATAPEPAEKGSKKEAKQARKQEKEAAEQEKKAEKRARKEARKQAERDAEAAEDQAKQERKAAKAEGKAAEEQKPEKEKRGFWSKATFGLVGGGKKEEAAEDAKPEEAKAQPEQATAATEPGVKEAESVDTAKADTAAPPAEPPTPIRGEHRGLAKISFKTEVSKEGETRSGLAKLLASRRTYSENGYGICDLGDVRIAVKGMTFPGEARAGGVVIQSDERGVAAGKSGRGNDAFAFQYEKGVTTCVFGTIKFTISKAVLSIDGHDVAMGTGHKLVVVNDSGKVDAVYNIGK